MNSSLESTAARPSFSIARTVILVRSRSVKNSVMPSSGRSSTRGAVRASSRIRWACCPLVVHTFCPLTSHPPSIFAARVVMRDVSAPAVGSVTPNAIRVSPLASLGSQARFIGAEPCRSTGAGGKT